MSQFLGAGFFVSGSGKWLGGPAIVDAATAEDAAVAYEASLPNDADSPCQVWVCDPWRNTPWVKFRIVTPPPSPTPPKKAVRVE